MITDKDNWGHKDTDNISNTQGLLIEISNLLFLCKVCGDDSESCSYILDNVVDQGIGDDVAKTDLAE